MPRNCDRLDQMSETVAGLREILNAQVKQLHIHAFHIKHLRDQQGQILRGEREVYRVIGPMIHMAAISGLSFLKLTDGIDIYVKDAFPVSRSIVENVVNTCYLMAEENEAAKAIRHAEFKSLSDLHREWEAGSTTHTLKWGGKLSAAAESRYRKLGSEFVTAKGRERNWTDKSLRQRLDAASGRFDHSSLMLLSSSAFNIYSTASEVVHGSYYSALYFFGLTRPGDNSNLSTEELHLVIADHQFSVLLSAFLAYASFVECFSEYSGQPDLRAEASEVIRQMRDLPAVAETLG